MNVKAMNVTKQWLREILSTCILATMLICASTWVCAEQYEAFRTYDKVTLPPMDAFPDVEMKKYAPVDPKITIPKVRIPPLKEKFPPIQGFGTPNVNVKKYVEQTWHGYPKMKPIKQGPYFPESQTRYMPFKKFDF